MRDKSNIQELVKISPDFVGFIFYHGSKRYVGRYFDPAIMNIIPANTGKVGVFVDEEIDSVCKKSDIYGLDLVQLHGRETAEYCRQLHARGVPLMKVFGIDEEFDFTALEPFKPSCKYFLFDTLCESFGGSGKKFNWDILERYDNSKPVFLSGGIGPDDAETIKKIKDINVHAVDINSRFEICAGLKDISKIKEFIHILKY